MLLPTACARRTSRIRRVVRFGPDKPLRLDAGVDLCAVPDRLPDLRHAQCRAHQRGADLPCAHRRSACRQRPSGHRQGRLVGDHGRPRPADRHRALFRHLPERDRRLHGHDRPGVDQSEDRQAVGPRFPGHHHPRHGAGAGDAARSSRHRFAVLGRRRLDGRHAGAAMGRELSRARVLGAADRDVDAPFGAEHRLPRGRPAGGDGRSGMAQVAAISRKRTNPRRGLAVARMGAHITYLSDAALHRKFGRRFQDRDNPDVLVRRRFPGGKLPAPPGHLASSSASTPIRISISRARWTISISPPTTTACSPTPSRTRRRASAWSRSPPTGCSRPRNSRAIVHALNAGGARVSFAEIVTDKGHDAFLLDEPELFAIVRGFLEGAAKARGLAAGAAMMMLLPPQARSHHGGCGAHAGRRARRLAGGRRHGRARREGARRRLRRRRIAAAAGGDAQCRRPRHRAVARGRQRRRRQGTRGDPGRRRHRPVGLSRRCLRLRDPVADAAGDAPAARRARAHAAHRPPRASCRSRISATGASGCRSCSAATCRTPTTCPMPGGTCPTSTSAPSRISASCAWWSAPRWSRRSRSTPGACPTALKVPWWFWNLFGEQAVFLLSRGNGRRSS